MVASLNHPISHLLLPIASFLLLLLLSSPVHAQITTPCTATAITGLTPCLNFLSNSTATGASSPTADCCAFLKNLTGTSMDCICLLVTASVPFQLPINRTLAISLPRACNMPGLPLQCKAAAGSPVPAPGPAALGPTLAPGVPSSDAPSSPVVPGTPSDSGTTPPALTPPSPATGTTPSVNSSPPSFPSLLLFALPFLLCKFLY